MVTQDNRTPRLSFVDGCGIYFAVCYKKGAGTKSRLSSAALCVSLLNPSPRNNNLTRHLSGSLPHIDLPAPKGVVKCRKFRFRFIILPDFMIEYQYQFCEVFIVIFHPSKARLKVSFIADRPNRSAIEKSSQKVVCNS